MNVFFLILPDSIGFLHSRHESGQGITLERNLKILATRLAGHVAGHIGG